jgi:hypothetical protein
MIMSVLEFVSPFLVVAIAVQPRADVAECALQVHEELLAYYR